MCYLMNTYLLNDTTHTFSTHTSQNMITFINMHSLHAKVKLLYMFNKI